MGSRYPSSALAGGERRGRRRLLIFMGIPLVKCISRDRGRLGLCIANLRCWYAEYVYFWISQALTDFEYRGNKCLRSILGLLDNEPGLLGKLDCRSGRLLPTLEEDLGYCAWFLVSIVISLGHRQLSLKKLKLRMAF